MPALPMTTLSMIPQTPPPGNLEAYLPVGVIVLMAIVFGVINIVGTMLIGPRRSGPVKELPYESGMNPLGGARKRFNVRFYILAMTFLVFDVEVIFLYPWATTFAQIGPGTDETFAFLGRALFFLFTTLIAYIYAFRKGVFRFD